METHERIEHEQARRELGDGLVEVFAVGRKIEPHGGGGDHLDVEVGERDGGGADGIESPAHDVQRILGGIEQNPSGARDLEAAQAWRAGRDRDGEIEGEEGFAAFGLAAEALSRQMSIGHFRRRISPSASSIREQKR